MSNLRKAAKRTGRRPVLVRWLDSSGPHGWNREEEFDGKPFIVETLGWELARTKTSIVIASHVADPRKHSEQFHAPIAIPRRAVLEYRRL